MDTEKLESQDSPKTDEGTPESQTEDQGVNIDSLSDDELRDVVTKEADFDSMSEEDLRKHVADTEVKNRRLYARTKKAEGKAKVEAPAAPETPTAPESKPAAPSTEEVEEARIQRALAKNERDKLLRDVNEEKRERVRETFEALTREKEMTPVNVADYMSIALKANDIRPPASLASQIAASASGTVPAVKKSLTKEQKKTAQLSGNTPDELENVDYSNMAGGEEFKRQERDAQLRTQTLI